ncbi:MAG: 50S ribosomal protein L24 [Bacteroidetes bacterium]|jgi:large subunit ribosomal protein L24|nr:MAG: 50S ribosomal protein L24 [Bacteroidota bacterium]
MANKLHIKKGDLVRVISGAGSKEKLEGRVLEVFPDEQKAIVEGARMIAKHEKPSQKNPNGGIVRREAPIHISNLMVIDPETKTPTRVGRRREEGTKGWVRYAKKSGATLK